MDMGLFDYELPKGMIAQERAVPRDSSRLFHIDARVEPAVHSHLRFSDIATLVDPGDILVLNRTRVIPARVPVLRGGGGKGEVLLLSPLEGSAWDALVKGKGSREGAVLRTYDSDVVVRLNGRIEGGRYRISFERGGRPMDHPVVRTWLDERGLMPTPPYIKRALSDPEEYQTVYGNVDGSVAAPTAGLHFTEELLDRLAGMGVRVRYLVLHVGFGTFAPIKSRDLEGHAMEGENFQISPELQAEVRSAVREWNEAGRSRIWPVGTTVMRALESAFGEDGRCHTQNGSTSLFIKPGYDFKLPYKGFITNFHLPRSTPLVLLSSFYGREKVLKAYEEAVSRGYRFYSFGDSMMVRRRR